MERYFLEQSPTTDSVQFDGAEANHLIKVKRASLGEEVVLFDGTGMEYRAEIEEIKGKKAQLKIIHREEVNRELDFNITVAVSLPKGDRQRWLIEKLVELGVQTMIPLITERSVAQPVDKAIERLRRTVIEASKQCRRNQLMEITAGNDWNSFLSADNSLSVDNSPSTKIVAHPDGEDWSQFISKQDTSQPSKDFIIAIGPEGGFSDQEINQAKEANWNIISLGPRILRIETAAAFLVALATLQS